MLNLPGSFQSFLEGRQRHLTGRARHGMMTSVSLSLPSPPKRWQIAPPAPPDFIARVGPLCAPGEAGQLLAQLLYNRDLSDPHNIQRFLDPFPPIPNPLQPPKLKGLDQAVTRLRQAMRRGEAVAVYGDYDVDGVTGTALLVETLTALGVRTQPYIPDRVDEGYGLNKEALARLREAGVSVVVTVDCGVRSMDEAAFARQIGLDMIITDHHQVAETLPTAVACVNPKQPGCPYPFKDLAGVGLAFKLAQALLTVEQRLGQANRLDPANLLDLAALGTVADLVPLVGENRTLVLHGLGRLNRPARPGLTALMAVAGLRPGRVDAGGIGFGLGPRLNAAGRIEHAMAAYQLLVTRDPAEATRLADELNSQNRERQRLTHETQERARALALAQDESALLLFAAAPDFRAGVVGLAAARLTEEFYRPAIVVEQGNTCSRGSCRSIPEFDITAALDQCADLLVRHGGHAAAAGFTVNSQHLENLAQRLRAIAVEQLSGQDLRPTLKIDAELELDGLSPATFQAVQRLEPCGYSNPTPVLCSRGVRVLEARPVGKEGGHLKLRLMGERFAWDAIAFRQGQHSRWIEPGAQIDVAYSLEENEWGGEKRCQLNVRDVGRKVGD